MPQIDDRPEENAATEQSALDIAAAFLDAWTGQDFKTAGGYLAGDFTFDGPIAHYRSAREFLTGSRGFAARLTGTWSRVAAFGDQRRPCCSTTCTWPTGRRCASPTTTP